MTDPRKDEPLASTRSTDSEREAQAIQLQGVIELREERLIVEKEREVAGSVAFAREVRRETVQIPVELVTEVLIIEHLGAGTGEGGQMITLDGTPLAPGERRELLVYREEAQVEKRVVVREQVKISKRQVVETRTFDATLAREELVVDAQGDVEVTGQTPEGLNR
ncbi:YsnF/AvaK domain-containing protein [Deinococcus humi]|uniref:Uncharacterized protein (TIGR02271 family) n=1 Tax=Deinococcus humi TaxID=662880 RepID=A0A7W8JX63_9DEIO|nr:YsnF/AvaK domain-containing protein [Deinococcus humi]MBB5363386.1 uncharacterized protein (TIGR02271 family) [Deinococcus humi]GGO26773.1 hypothetical protein GCM10008949_17830 [Deinococcus humi]